MAGVKLCGEAAGKLLLFGEHSAVYGHPALGLPLPLATTLELHVFAPHELGAAGLVPGEFRLEGLSPQEEELFWKISAEIFPCTGEIREHWGGRISFRTEVPAAGGYGSSAAVCGSIAGAWFSASEAGRVLFRASGIEFPAPRREESLAEAANRGERIFHGTPSGIDAILSLSRGLTGIHPQPGKFPSCEELKPGPLYLVTGTLPRTLTTGELVREIRILREHNPVLVDSLLNELGAIAGEALATLRSSPIRGASPAGTTGNLADRAQEKLASLGLSVPRLDRALAVCRRSGACGAKLSGAGGGGAFYAVAEHPEQAFAVYEALCGFFSDEGLPSADLLSPLRVEGGAGAFLPFS